MANERECGVTKILIDIARRGHKTEVCFTHAGLWPDDEYFRDYSSAWSSLIRGGLAQRRLLNRERK
jgi:hypothetical protein